MFGQKKNHPDSQISRQIADILSARQQVEAALERKRHSPAPNIYSPASVDIQVATLQMPSIPGYSTFRELHRGGQGIVFQALQESTKRVVAIKIMHQRSGGRHDALMRFERETQLLGRLNHPNIVAIHDSGTADGHAYFTMDYVRGVPLDAYVKSARLNVEQTLRLFLMICDAVHEAHVRGIIHRDLKPGNILVDQRGQPRILDFGLAKVSDAVDGPIGQAVTETGQFVGSIPWASPEQAQARWQDVDIRSDVYSLGILLYQLLTGAFPYRVSGSPRDIVENIVEREPVRPSAIRRQVDGEVETIILKCLHKEPPRRYQSAGEFARDLRNYFDGRPIEARRDSGWYVFHKTLRRHRVPVAFGLLVLVFAAAGVVGLFLAQYRQAQLRAEAQRQAAVARAVNQFLNQDLLAAVKPQQKGREVTVREVLDEASLRIEQQFPQEPVIEAAIRETLGNTYMELGEWKAAINHAERALILRRSELGTAHADTLAAMQLTGRLYRRLGRYAEAGAILQEMVAMSRATLGSDHPLTTQGMNNLAYALDELGRVQESIEVNGEALKIRTRTLGPEHPETLRSVHNQGYYFERLGRYDDAERLYATAYRLREGVLGKDHPDTLASMVNLANVWTGLNRFDDAERLHLERLQSARAVYGERHPAVLLSTGMLGDLYRRQGRYGNAEAMLLEALEGWRPLVGVSHRNIAVTLWRLGEVYIGQERYGEAEEALARAVEVFRDTLGLEHGQTCGALGTLGRLYLHREKFEQAERLLVESVHCLKVAYGRHHETCQIARRDLVILYETWHAAESGRGYDAKATDWKTKLDAAGP